ncbi:acetyl-CoA carboxylase biotin carboxylase subunit [Carnobacterium maltaromaticum]|uniref:acetyl-CoA carboxylase biotin carboxylase subunit n=1 Tax=Carnobacterium maltaromaticum TaxID=2751 RepID=UPI0010728B80|nr:acetyl-CoA carboxylase biotin carboxylase subunit [Carnobacterium maltaromaticum]TFJ74419.1 acetyl-CoA carboxylase biotin carboxylase subunit [Carnobacterium maltaromaticum]TFJ78190.1 acetyl-CoA carboxylase biotin carboxylase subunit [Carnobacterium maltaromaticum]
MFTKILVANRGEIAVRIIRACKELGIRTVAVYSEADKDALHMQLADEAICIGPAKATDSYLNMQSILSAAVVTKAQAIHPGFGFLSENSVFATMCGECNITFIGPDAETIDMMGNKANARALMIEADVPVIPGSDGFVTSVEMAVEIADQLGYPVMLKAAAGGGGKGIRKVMKPEELEAAYLSASSEAGAAFGDDRMYMERIIQYARHIEVQILADNYGHVIHLGERDCSLQRNNQKIIEESPSVAISDKERQILGETAVRAAKHVGYKNAGTIEFLVDQNGFYFMEMNTRIQVEHPVTEMATGIDIVKEQLLIASGKKMTLEQSDIHLTGHTIECRINAENPAFHFAPSPGRIDYLLLPSGGLGLRVDSAMFAGYEIPPYYDAMIAKIITKGENRSEAIAKMKRALSELVIDGIVTNQFFQEDLLQDERFVNGDYDTNFLQDTYLPEWTLKNS